MGIKKGSFGGYVGEYNGNILKSSYEYIFAKILEYENIKYKVEENTYLLDDGETYYTPDFFLYNDEGVLYEIIEIRGHRLNIEERIESTNKLKNILPSKIDIKLFTEIDIRRMCKERGLSYNQLKTYWRTNPNNVKGSSKGEANSMYGKEQTQKTRELISSKGKERARQNPEKYYKMGKDLEQWCRERNYDFLRGDRVLRYTLICQWCGSEFEVTEGQKDKRKFCSNKCGTAHATEVAGKMAIKEREKRDENLKEYILNWSMKHKDIIINTPYNRITPHLKDLLDSIKEEFNVIDFRTISRFIGSKHRKDFLRKLKEYVG